MTERVSDGAWAGENGHGKRKPRTVHGKPILKTSCFAMTGKTIPPIQHQPMRPPSPLAFCSW